MKGLDNSKKFLVIDFVVHFSGAKGGGIISNGTKFL